ncbi:MAG: hypothetical protein ACOX6N_03480 [Patescibacteria group bacterium]|jgi:hypothetical protein
MKLKTLGGILLTGFLLSACSLKQPTVKTPTPTGVIVPTTIPTETPANNMTVKLTPTKISTPTIDPIKACMEEDRYLTQIKDECGSMPFPGIDECIQMRIDRAEVELKESNLARANKMKELKPLYLQAKANCRL